MRAWFAGRKIAMTPGYSKMFLWLVTARPIRRKVSFLIGGKGLPSAFEMLNPVLKRPFLACQRSQFLKVPSAPSCCEKLNKCFLIFWVRNRALAPLELRFG